jgi:hypothetical protein
MLKLKHMSRSYCISVDYGVLCCVYIAVSYSFLGVGNMELCYFNVVLDG